MRRGSSARNEVKAARTSVGLSQQELARASGVTRQTIGGIEAGLYSPSVTVALRVAGVLGRRVEELFWLDDQSPIDAALAAGSDASFSAQGATAIPISLGRVGSRWIAHPLQGAGAFRSEMPPADGMAVWDNKSRHLRVQLLDGMEALDRTVILAGCSPALSLLARVAERCHPGLRVQWVQTNSLNALQHLARREVHIAGVHLWDAKTGSANSTYVRRTLPNREVMLVTLGVWEEGLVVRPGNPLRIQSVKDLARHGVTIVNREKGAGARVLLSLLLARAGIPHHKVRGFERVATDHVAVARAVGQGAADAGVTAAAIARACALPFIPLQRVRYDLVLLRESLTYRPVQQLLALLGDRRARAQLESVGGYDTSQTGTTVAPAS